MLKIVLTKNQWKRISDILNNLGLLSTASIVAPALFDKPSFYNVIFGSVAAFMFWLLSILSARKY